MPISFGSHTQCGCYSRLESAHLLRSGQPVRPICKLEEVPALSPRLPGGYSAAPPGYLGSQIKRFPTQRGCGPFLPALNEFRMMWNPILEEIWPIKDQIAREANYDIHPL